jgi:hypothetical protein
MELSGGSTKKQQIARYNYTVTSNYGQNTHKDGKIFNKYTYLDAMAKRFEVLASTKTYLSISDSRCIEWCYGKNALIKKLVGDFLSIKIEEGFIGFEDALEIAGDWLYDAPAKLYGINEVNR